MSITNQKHTTVAIHPAVSKSLKELSKNWNLSGSGEAILYMVDYFKKTGINPKEDKFEDGFSKILKRQNYVVSVVKDQEKNTKKYFKELTISIRNDIEDLIKRSIPKNQFDLL